MPRYRVACPPQEEIFLSSTDLFQFYPKLAYIYDLFKGLKLKSSQSLSITRSNSLKMSDPTQNHQEKTIIVTHQKSQSNGTGTAGFVLALIALFFGWIPLAGWLLWFLGMILSFIGVFKKPRGLAIAGLVISFIGIILLIFLFAGLAFLGTTQAL